MGRYTQRLRLGGKAHKVFGVTPQGIPIRNDDREETLKDRDGFVYAEGEAMPRDLQVQIDSLAIKLLHGKSE